MKRTAIIFAFGLTLAMGMPARAVLLDVVPVTQTITEGDGTTVDVFLRDPGGELISAFGIIVTSTLR